MERLVFLFSLMALAVLHCMNTTPEFQEPVVILQIGIAVLVVVWFFYFLITRRNPPKDTLFYVFAEFSFTCVIDLVSAMEHDGFISGFMEFYQKTGEPYLGTAYAIMMCYWDGIVHFIMYLMMIQRLWNSKSYRTLGLFWAGSLFANMSVFVTGIVVGKFGSDIRPAFWLNMPFLMLPIWGAIKLFNQPKNGPTLGGYRAHYDQSFSLIWRPTDLLLVLLLLGAMTFTLFRGLVALDSPLEACTIYLRQYEPYLKDPVGYPKVMMLHFLFYMLPMLGAFIYGLVVPGCTWMPDWTVFVAGGVAQCQWAHIGASLHPRTVTPFRIPDEAFLAVLAANLLYAVIPSLIAMRCTSNTNFFLTVTKLPGMEGMPWVPDADTLVEKKHN
ncbi:transmembrane 6 superfamily member 1 [Salmo trutta]|uniref:Transmembrane 6 superfamily member 2b n=1 Tax=Salmo trutta TaxID=8032 RepID=A0A674DQG4_SALTR|nr:transmembrane 6 superfamily member 1-like [Salmo trutta]